jgi:ElaA protein
MEKISWSLKQFDELTTTELYRILELRNRVFVVEQNCVYNDTDGMDSDCHHLCGWRDGQLLAYARIVPPGMSYAEPSIGRVVSNPSIRKTGLGKELMKRAIEGCEKLFKKNNIRISAQSYLIDFYINMGFSPTGKEYLEDGIPHTEMLFRQ